MLFLDANILFNYTLTLMITCFNKNKKAVNNFSDIDNHNRIFNPGDSDNVSFMSGQFDIWNNNH